eukprot:RCo036837
MRANRSRCKTSHMHQCCQLRSSPPIPTHHPHPCLFTSHLFAKQLSGKGKKERSGCSTSPPPSYMIMCENPPPGRQRLAPAAAEGTVNRFHGSGTAKKKDEWAVAEALRRRAPPSQVPW